MGKRNQITTKLEISADAQLQNSRKFIRDIEKIAKGLDVSSKLYSQLDKAKKQLNDCNKVLEKINGKSIVDDKDLQAVTKAGKEIASIMSKVSNLYDSYSSDDLRKISKEYVAEIEAREKAALKIKEEYNKKTGKIYDKEIANYGKLKAKIKELEKEQKKLSETGIDSLVQKQVEETNKKLEEQKKKLQEIEKLRANGAKAFTSAANASAKKSGYESYDQLKNTKVLTEKQVANKITSEGYAQQKAEVLALENSLKNILNIKDQNVDLDTEATKMAKEYNLQNVNNLATLQKEVKLRREVINSFKNDKTKLRLQYEKAITAELRKQEAIKNAQTAAKNAGEAAELAAIQGNPYGYQSKAGLNAGYTATTKSVESLQATLSEDGLSTIATNAANLVTQRLDKIATSLAKLTGEATDIEDATSKLSTQSERMADEGDIVAGAKQQIDATNKDGNSTRAQVAHTEQELTNQIAKREALEVREPTANLMKTMNGFFATNPIEQLPTSQMDFKDVEILHKINETLDDTNNEYAEAQANIERYYDMLGQNMEAQEFNVIIQQIRENLDIASKQFKIVNGLSLGLANKRKDANSKALDEIYKHNSKGEVLYDNTGKPQLKKGKEEEYDRLTKERNIINGVIASIENDLTKFDMYYTELDSKAKKATNVLNSNSNQAESTAKSLNVLADASKNEAINMEEAAKQSAFLSSTFDDIKNKIGYFLSLNYVFDQVTRKITEAVQTTKEMDKDMTQIGLVLNKTAGQVWKNFDSYSQMAERLNTTTSQVTNSMKLFYQQGLNTSEVNKMVEASAIAAALGESSLAEASETLTSILNSYNLRANEAMEVTDKISQIAIVSAADFGELSTAIEKVASSAASAGLDLDHMMGYLAKMIETTREAPTNIGTALKTIVANFTQFKEDPSQLNIEGSDINKVDKALKSVGISLTNANGEVRDLGDVLDELGGIWDNLNRSQKSYLATQIAGTRQQSRFYALMNDYERTLELVAEGSNSAGKAQQQFALYSNSLEAAANRLTNQWEKFFNDITKGNGLVANFTNILTGLMKIVNTIGPIGTALGLGEGVKLARDIVSTFDSLKETVKKRSNNEIDFADEKNSINGDDKLSAEDRVKKLDEATKNYNKNQLDSLKGLTEAQVKYINSVEQINKQQEVFNKKIKTMPKLVQPAAKALGNLKTGTQKAFASIKLGAKQVGNALASIATHFVILAAVSAGLKLINIAVDEVKNALGLNTEAYIENAEKAQENAENVSGLMQEYEGLAKKVNKTAEEQKRLKEITEEITKIDSKLGQQLEDNVHNYEANIQAMEDYIALQEKMAAQESARAIMSEGSTNILNGLKTVMNGDWAASRSSSKYLRDQMKAEQQSNWRALSNARGTEYQLSGTQISILNKYTEALIDAQEKQNWDALHYKFNTDEFNDMITRFILSLQKMTEAQESAYNKYLEMYGSGNYSQQELFSYITSMNVSDEIKGSLYHQLNGRMETVKAQIMNNPYTAKANQMSNAYRANSLPIGMVEKLLAGANASTLSKNEKTQYLQDLDAFFSSDELVTAYSKALDEGEKAVNDFAEEIEMSGIVSELFTENMKKSIASFSAEEIDNIWSNLGKIGELSIQSNLKGEVSQSDILKEFAKGTISFEDLDFASGTVTIKNAALVSFERAQLDKMFNAVYAQFDAMTTEQKKATLQPLNDVTGELKDFIAKQKYVQEIGNVLSQYETQAQNEKNAHATANKNTPTIPLPSNYVYQRSVELAYTTGYEGGYDPTKKTYTSAVSGPGGFHDKINVDDVQTSSLKYNIEAIDREKRLQGNNYKVTDEHAAIRSEYASRTVNTGIKDTSQMTGQQKYDYFVQQNQELEASKEKLKDLDKTSQEYYNETYKIYAINKDLQEVLKTDEELYTQITSSATDLGAEIQKNTEEVERQVKHTNEISDQLDEEIKQQRNKIKIVEDYMRKANNAQAANLKVFDVGQSYQQIMSTLDGVKQAYAQIGDEAASTGDVINLVAQDPTLIDCLELQNGALEWNKTKLEERGRAAIEAADAKAESAIAELEIVKACLQTEGDNIDEWSENAIDKTAKVIGGNTSLTDSQQTNTEAEGTNLSISQQNWINWSDTTVKAIEAAGKAYNEFLKSQATKTEGTYDQGGFSATGNIETGGTKGSSVEDLTNNEKVQMIKDTLKADGRGQDKAGVIANIDKQIERINKFRELLKREKDGIGGVLGGGKAGSGGSKDEFEPIVEKLEKFYNYLRQLEELEARINRIREKRNLIDTSKTYYIDKLQQENDLLREQQAIYNNYIRDQGTYLNELKGQIQTQFGNWAYFNEDGVIQVKQTEFTANSEEEEERLNLFLELVELYKEEYNTREENINTLYDLEHSQLENIQEMYDKVLARIQDINDALNRQADLLDHQSTMSFSNIGKFGIMDDKALVAVEGLKKSQAYLNDYEGQIKALSDEVRNGPFSELLIWDETLQVWRTNEEALNDPAIVKKYEAMGYTWQDIDTYCRSVAVKSQSIQKSWEETTDAANAFAELLKSLIDDRISLIQDLFGAATDELNKVFDTFDNKITDLDNQNDLFGTTSESLEEKYLTLVTAAAVLKQTIQSLEDNRGSIIERIQKDYPEYIEMINGIAVVNKQAIEESNNLSDEQKAELLQLYGILEAADGQITEMNDKLIDYFSNMMEMEEAKRDAIIEMKQAIHDELIARDQEEIDNLQAKYDKMSQLDNEYYSELQQRINDARDLRDRRQESANIGQMQARLAVLKADNSGTYNTELIELQKQIQQALQAQADNDVNRELERIQREQQQREEDRQLTISAMENVLTFKDDNNWYWQEAQRIWDEGPESVTGFLRSSREYANISDEQRNQLFENLTTSMNTAFTTLQTAAGQTAITSDGVVTTQAGLIMDDLDFIQGQLGEGSTLATKIDWSNTQNVNKLTALDSTVTGIPNTIKTNMNALFTDKIKPGVDGAVNTITSYLGTDSAIWKKLDGMNTNLGTLTSTTYYDNLNGIVNALTGDGANSIASILKTSKTEYLKSTGDIYKWLDETYRKEHAPEPETKTEATVTPPSNTGGGSSGSNSGGNGSGAGNSVTTAPALKIGSSVTVKPGTRWYYDSYGTNPSGTARGGKIKHINLKGSHQYNIDGLGWIKKTDIVGYSKGGYVDYTGIANVHGSSTSPEAFLNAKQTRLFEALRDNLTKTASNRVYDKTDDEITKEEYNIDNINIQVQQIADVDAIDKVTKRVKEEIYKDSIGHNNMAVRRR